jgi:hypothetical protein
MQQITGTANIGTSSDGILITKHGEGTDLIDKAIQNNGQVPAGDIKVFQTRPQLDNKQSIPAKTNTAPQTKSNNPAPDTNTAARPRATQSPSPTPKP